MTKNVTYAKKEEVKDIDVKKPSAVAEHAGLDAWGESPISSNDIIIPRILLMNPTSDMVTEGQASFGEFRDSLTLSKLGDFKTNFKFIPFAVKKMFVEYDMTNPKEKKFLRMVPITPSNESLPYEDSEKNAEGKMIPISRDYTMNFYGLLPSEVARGGELPYILSFRRSSLQQGKKLATQMYVTNRGSKIPPPGITVTIAAKKTSNDQSTWAIPEVLLSPEFTNLTKQNEMERALQWFKMINLGVTRDDEEALAKPEAESVVVSDSGPANF